MRKASAFAEAVAEDVMIRGIQAMKMMTED
jgi:hypothetical protein